MLERWVFVVQSIEDSSRRVFFSNCPTAHRYLTHELDCVLLKDDDAWATPLVKLKKKGVLEYATNVNNAKYGFEEPPADYKLTRERLYKADSLSEAVRI